MLKTRSKQRRVLGVDTLLALERSTVLYCMRILQRRNIPATRLRILETWPSDSVQMTGGRMSCTLRWLREQGSIQWNRESGYWELVETNRAGKEV